VFIFSGREKVTIAIPSRFSRVKVVKSVMGILARQQGCLVAALSREGKAGGFASVPLVRLLR
jgi:hypothetical protein